MYVLYVLLGIMWLFHRFHIVLYRGYTGLYRFCKEEIAKALSYTWVPVSVNHLFAELVREVVKENVLDLYERRHPQAVLSSYKRELQVPSIHNNINISMKRY